MPPAELLAALTDAVQTALGELASVACAPGGGAPAAAELTAALPVTTASGAGFLALAMPEATARELARRVLAGVAEPDAATVRDCAGEVVNVIAGQAKTRLHGTPQHFTLGTPLVTSNPPDACDAVVIAFESDAGPFALYAHLPQ